MNKQRFVRAICTLLMLAMVFTMAVPFANAAGGTYYPDIDDDTELGRAVNYLYDHDIMKNPIYALPSKTSALMASRFCKDQAITRLQLVHAMWNMVGSPEEVGATTRMRDAYINSEHSTAMRWAINAGILDYVSTGRYTPDASMTVEETILMLYRFVDYCGYNVNAGRTTMYRLDNSETAKALSWAINKKFITKLSFRGDFTVDCSRGNAAIYIYKIYEIYQKKYALTVVDTYDLRAAEPSGTGMANLFTIAGSKTISRQNIDFSSSSDGEDMCFVDSMKEAFSEAKALDICYLFMYSHGNTNGLALFKTANLKSSYWDRILTPVQLRNEIDKYDGTFVVMISGCKTGTYVNKGVSSDYESFDAEAFMSELVTESNVQSAENTSGGILCGNTNRIKALCSSTQTEYSWSKGTFSYAVRAWLKGCGYLDAIQEFTGDLVADLNGDNKVSLEELFDFAYAEVEKETFPHDDGNTYKQHMVCYPENDDTIIFEVLEWEFPD